MATCATYQGVTPTLKLGVMAICSEPGCGLPVRARGICINHYNLFLKHGKLIVNSTKGMSPQDRIRSTSVEQFVEGAAVEGPCWISTGKPHRITGYCRVSVGGVRDYAHRQAWRAFHGEIPEGWEVDHLCFIRACCNPDHLEAVTSQVNCDRKEARNRSPLCPSGHEMSGDNLVFSDGSRVCRICRNNRQRVRWRTVHQVPEHRFRVKDEVTV